MTARFVVSITMATYSTNEWENVTNKASSFIDDYRKFCAVTKRKSQTKSHDSSHLCAFAEIFILHQLIPICFSFSFLFRPLAVLSGSWFLKMHVCHRNRPLCFAVISNGAHHSRSNEIHKKFQTHRAFTAITQTEKVFFTLRSRKLLLFFTQSVLECRHIPIRIGFCAIFLFVWLSFMILVNQFGCGCSKILPFLLQFHLTQTK